MIYAHKVTVHLMNTRAKHPKKGRKSKLLQMNISQSKLTGIATLTTLSLHKPDKDPDVSYFTRCKEEEDSWVQPRLPSRTHPMSIFFETEMTLCLLFFL